MTRTIAIVLAAGSLAGCLAGCVDSKNQRLTIGDGIPLASFPPEVVEPTVDEDGTTVLPEPPADDEPSVLGLSRANFEPVVYRVPIDGTYHELHGLDVLAFPSETARQRGEFPTATSALETGGWPSTRDQIAEVLAQPFVAAGGALFHTVGLVYPEWLAAHFVSGSVSSPPGLRERAPAHLGVEHRGVEHMPIDAAATPEAIPERTPADGKPDDAPPTESAAG